MSTDGQATVENVIEALEQVVEHFGPEASYSQVYRLATGMGWRPGEICQYATSDGSPLCIVGQALADLGFSLPISAHGKPLNGPVDRYVEEYFPGEVSDEACQVLLAAQRAQDGGSDWGTALAAARERAAALAAARERTASLENR